jgi:hypothetical protein
VHSPIWIENTKRFHPLEREFFTLQEDDLNFSYKRISSSKPRE